jgi:hypothetical protein
MRRSDPGATVTTVPAATSTTASTSTGSSAPSVSVTTTVSPTSTKGLGEEFAFGETAYVTNEGARAAEITVGRPVDFVSTNPYTTPDYGRLVYVPITVKVTGSQPIPVQSTDFEIDLPDGDVKFHLFVSGMPADVPEDIEETTVQPGQTLTAAVPFDVLKDLPLKVAYAPVLKDLAHWS